MLITSGALALGVTAFVTAAAQTQEKPAAGASVTVVGCLQRPARSGSVAGTPQGGAPTPQQAGVEANRSDPAPGFLLTDAATQVTPPQSGAPAAEGRTGGGAGTAGSAAVSASAAAGENPPERKTSYMVEGDANLLTQHLGQRVEITGTIAPAPQGGRSAAPPDPLSSAGPPTPRGGDFAEGIQHLHATAVKTVAADCNTGR
jgi:hypothetical protein